MSAIIRSLVGLLAALLLASCGGGGGSGENSPFEPAGGRVTVTVASASTTPNSLVGITVEGRAANGQALPDGTQVRVSVSPPGVGLVSATSGANLTVGDQAVGTLSGGVATFRFHSRNLGSAVITASITDPNVNRTLTDTESITVGAGAPSDPRLTLSCVTNTLPVNNRRRP